MLIMPSIFRVKLRVVLSAVERKARNNGSLVGLS